MGTQECQWHFQSANRHFRSAEQHFPSAEWHTFGPWPEDIGITLKDIIFNFLVIRTRPSSYSDHLSYFFEPSILYKQRLGLKIQHTFSRSQISPLSDSLFWYFLSYIKEVLEALVLRIFFCKQGVLDFKDNSINFFEPLNILS